MFDFRLKGNIIFWTIIILIPIIVTMIWTQKDQPRVQSNRTIIINEENFSAKINMEDFIPLVLMTQMPVDSPKALLRAQSVVIRTYILKCMGDRKEITTSELRLPYILPERLKEIWFEQYKVKEAHTFFGVMANLTGMGASTIYEQNLTKLHNILLETDSYVMKWQDDLILPMFHESSNGKTRSGQENLGEEFSYLKSVDCYGSGEIEGNKRSVVLSVEEIKTKLGERGIIPYAGETEVFTQSEIIPKRFLELVDLTNRDSAGYVVSVRIGDTLISGNDFADTLGLVSTSFELSVENEDIKIQTMGVGHGFGMSLEYAETLAREKKSWKEILKTFFDAEICIY